MKDGIFFNQSKYIKEMLKKFGLEDSKPTRTLMSTEIKLTKDDEADYVDSSKYLGLKIPSEYQQDYKKTRAYAPKIYNDPNMSDTLRDIYRTLESRYVHEGITINPSFYNDLSDDSVTKFTIIDNPSTLPTSSLGGCTSLGIDETKFYHGMIFIRLFKNLKENMAQGSFDERKSKRTQLSTSSSSESPPSDNRVLSSTKLSPRSYHKALKDDPNMSKEQRETRGMFKNLGRELHNFARMLKKGCR
ncbi:hypothetical protein Tco_0490883 [Tanacetum coccineum]